eukprot:TRINITY_DN41725_c0_g1_i2.p1 TRINITY_DN41725_c0_g1~~TRINITY_DN41725_c0_g1_i2.p1  ORF type:complete len:329 (+),score=41.60 TRINITY_DN41725_c0_g1_i2:73-1059(+)
MGCGAGKHSRRPEAAEEESPDAVDEFQLTLQRRSKADSLGLLVVDEVDEVDATLRIEAVRREGLVSAFMRANANELDLHFKVGYRIVAVNGVCGDCEAMRNELEEQVVVLTVQRNESFPMDPRAMPEQGSGTGAISATESSADKADDGLALLSESTASTAVELEDPRPDEPVAGPFLSEASTETLADDIKASIGSSRVERLPHGRVTTVSPTRLLAVIDAQADDQETTLTEREHGVVFQELACILHPVASQFRQLAAPTSRSQPTTPRCHTAGGAKPEDVKIIIPNKALPENQRSPRVEVRETCAAVQSLPAGCPLIGIQCCPLLKHA